MGHHARSAPPAVASGLIGMGIGSFCRPLPTAGRRMAVITKELYSAPLARSGPGRADRGRALRFVAGLASAVRYPVPPP